jgi:hypothetical protein
MTEPAHVEVRYLSASYITEHPSWALGDFAWKAGKVLELLKANFIVPKSMVDVGCGPSGVLMQMIDAYPNASLSGYDIAPHAERFWVVPRDAVVDLVDGNYLDSSVTTQDVKHLLDVVEHPQDQSSFLSKLKGRAKHYFFHFPLDLSAVSVLRESSLLFVSDKVGHVQHYTRGLALALLNEYGYQVGDARFTGAAFNTPRRGWKTILPQIPHRLAFALNQDRGVRFFDGETLTVLAVDAAAK